MSLRDRIGSAACVVRLSHRHFDMHRWMAGDGLPHAMRAGRAVSLMGMSDASNALRNEHWNSSRAKEVESKTIRVRVWVPSGMLGPNHPPPPFPACLPK